MNETHITANMHNKPIGASVILNGRYLAPPEDGDGQLWVRTSAIILASPENLYLRWRDVERVIDWHEQTISVRKTGDTTSHWIMQVSDRTIQWDSEVLTDEPGRRIAWRSIGGDLDEAGEVIFEPAVGGHGTMVSLLQQYRMGPLENFWHTVKGRNPKQGVIESLRHFKALVETGEIPRTHGQPHGPRGTVANLERSAFGETILQPPGELRHAG